MAATKASKKKEVLSSDIELIKELEQLRLKQQLLLSSLKGSSKQDKNSRLLDEINSKLDFLVSLFKEAKEQEGTEKKILEKIGKLEERVESTLKEFKNWQGKLEKEKKESGQISDNNSKFPQQEKNHTEQKSNFPSISAAAPPPPRIDLETVFEEKPKKRWFGK